MTRFKNIKNTKRHDVTDSATGKEFLVMFVVVGHCVLHLSRQSIKGP